MICVGGFELPTNIDEIFWCKSEEKSIYAWENAFEKELYSKKDNRMEITFKCDDILFEININELFYSGVGNASFALYADDAVDSTTIDYKKFKNIFEKTLEEYVKNINNVIKELKLSNIPDDDILFYDGDFYVRYSTYNSIINCNKYTINKSDIDIEDFDIEFSRHN